MRAVTAAQMRAIDAAAVAREGEVALMRAAGEAIASLIDRYARVRDAGLRRGQEPAELRGGAVVAVAGSGNNGGDAYAALAAYRGARARIVYGDPAVHGSEARRDARDAALRTGVVEHPFPPDPAVLRDAALILDGALGVNARLPLDARSADLVDAMNASGAPVLALDVPTGIDPTTGVGGEHAVRATATVALGRPKLGCFLEPARDLTGELWCAPIGMRDEDADALGDPRTEVLTPDEFAALLPVRPQEADKRSSGAPLIIAGSTQFPGAAILCAWGAARAGAGYVTLASTDGAATALRTQLVEQVVVTYDERDPEQAVRTVLDLTNRCNSIGIGPGLGLSDAFGTIVNGVIGGTDLPVVADASALYHLVKRLPSYRGKNLVITPHAGEFARISGKGTIAPGERLTRLRAFVDEHGVVTLLKGRTTLIGGPGVTHLNPTGTNALATAGTGDVLTGVIATLLAQGLSPLDAARVGAYWHGRAGQIALERRHRGVVARDVDEALGAASVVEPTAGPVIRIF
ncbi:MAG TPA: NAD(P)H-hydrate dehydratase [Candidatus Elarobacter sp.]|jgi:NAD(P)H-hydrate epimerase|nr:NAD(P)H-hydrate dehydratase [Candidatus Elarobacter sp.]